MLIKSFSDESGRVWVADGKKIYSTNPKLDFVHLSRVGKRIHEAVV